MERPAQHSAVAGRADWNDTLNLDTGKGVAERIHVDAVLPCCKRMAELAEHLGRNRDISRFRDMSRRMRDAINETCWDGE